MSQYSEADLCSRFQSLCQALDRTYAPSPEQAATGNWYLEETARGFAIRECCRYGPPAFPLGANHYSLYHLCRALELALLCLSRYRLHPHPIVHQ